MAHNPACHICEKFIKEVAVDYKFSYNGRDLPLIIIPGAGTELYRGLATVIVGGMMVSTLFTLILLPSLLRIGEDKLQLKNI